ncbi:hypothetical protein CK203_097006 [Vitis vinifera]|uniref:Polygalacturonase n=1 Tax=Vitis vinifera TaxID=29760 RepID=A0A438CFV3_VITVI|nr:hypothetical protein CK203_097006 [Vitis vinifera]
MSIMRSMNICIHSPEFHCHPSPAPEAASPSYNGYSSIYTAVFNVRSFGAVGDGVTDDTQAFRWLGTLPAKPNQQLFWFRCCSRRRQLIGSELGFFLFSLDDEKIEGTIMAPDGQAHATRQQQATMAGLLQNQ